MSGSAAETFGPIMKAVAIDLLGDPNRAASNGQTLRWGTHGSMKIDLEGGVWHDKEANEGGGVIDLVMRQRECDKAGALKWLEEKGHIEPADADPGALYDYRDETGAVLFRVERRSVGSASRFLQHGPDGQGGFKCREGCMRGVRRVPYRLPELVASARDDIVFVCEGEKDADRLASIGLIATTNPGGAGKFLPEFAAFFEGRRVVILEDRDEAGRAHAEDVLAKLESSAAAVAIVRLPGLPSKGDVSDWLNTGGSAHQLVHQFAEPALEKPRESVDGSSIEATPYEWMNPDQIPVRPWLFGRWLLRGTVAAVIAPGGIGKTTLLSGIALSMVTGRDMLGKTVWDGPKRVWMWNLEDPLLELKRTMQANALHWGLSRDDLEGRLFVDSAMEGRGLCTAIEDQAGFKLLMPIYEAITAELIRLKIDMLVVDPFVSSHEVEENANSKIDAIVKAWGRVANATNCAIVLVHHTSKAGAADVTALSARGAKALTDACRTVLVLNRMDSDEAERLGFDDRERRRYFNAQDDKHNRAPAENTDWFRLESVDLGNGGLAQSDSIGVAVPWRAPDPFEGLTVDDLYRAQQEVDGGNWRADWQSPDWVGVAVAKALGLDAGDKVSRRRILQLLRTWIDAKSFVTVVGKDKKGNDRKFVEVGKWANDFSN